MPYYFLTLALLLCLPGCFRPTLAQGTPPPDTGLQIGQPVPDNLVLDMVNYPTPTARLSDLKGKLLILDFYATWCSSSRVPLPLLDELQKEFGDKLQVLLVSYTNARDNRASVEAFFEKWRNPDGSRYRLPSVVNDTALIKRFPHQSIPHFIWVDPNGSVQAITRAEQVTAVNVRRAITEGVMPPSLLPDIDLTGPLFSSADLTPAHRVHYAYFVKGKVDDSSIRSEVRHDASGAPNGIVIANMPLLELYETAMQKVYPEFGNRKLELAGVDSALLFLESSGLTAADWNKQHTYAYDLQLPEQSAADLYRVMLEDLNRYSGHTAALEMQETECLLLVRKGRKDRLQSKGGEPLNSLFSPVAPRLRNMPLKALVARLNGNKALQLLVVDRTGYTAPVDLEVRSGFSDLPALRRELQAYGLDLVQKRIKTPIPVLRKQPAVTSSSQPI